MRKLLLLVAAAALVLSLASCSIIRNMKSAVNAARAEASAWAAEQLNKNTPAADETAKSVAQDTAVPETDNGKRWPEDIPSDIPAFSYGWYSGDETIRTESKDTLSYILHFQTVSKDQVRQYGDALKAAGLDVTTTESSGNYSVTGMKMKDYHFVASISVYWDANSKSCSVAVMVNKTDNS